MHEARATLYSELCNCKPLPSWYSLSASYCMKVSLAKMPCFVSALSTQFNLTTVSLFRHFPHVTQLQPPHRRIEPYNSIIPPD
jgi:hypothetical protein